MACAYLLGNLRFELVEGLYVMLAPGEFGAQVLGIAAFEWSSLVAEDGFGIDCRPRAHRARRRSPPPP